MVDADEDVYCSRTPVKSLGINLEQLCILLNTNRPDVFTYQRDSYGFQREFRATIKGTNLQSVGLSLQQLFGPPNFAYTDANTLTMQS